jgi:hypothetical protein
MCGNVCGTDAPDPPDYTPVAEASAEAAKYARDTSREQLAWAKEQWGQQYELMQDVLDVQLPMMEAQLELAGAGMDAYLEGLNMQMDIAWENHQNALKDRDRYERVFQPIENDLIQEFLAYDTQARQSLEAGRAQADVARAQDAQRKQAMASLESYGIDPGQTRSAALDASLRTQEASAQAAAGNQARQNVENTGRALRAEGINIGRGLPSNVAQSYGLALQGAGGAQSAGNAATNQLNQTMTGIGSNAGAWQGAAGVLGNGLGWNQAGNQAIGQWGNTLNTGYQNRLQQWNNSWTGNDTLNLLGGIAGMGLGGFMGGMFSAEGGVVDPELVEGPGGYKDSVTINAQDGEFVVSKGAAEWLGLKKLNELMQKAEDERAEYMGQQEATQQEAQARRQGIMLAEAGAPTDRTFMAEGGAVNTSHAATRGRTGNQGGFGYRSDIANVGYNTAQGFSSRRAAMASRLNNLSSGYSPNSSARRPRSDRSSGFDFRSRFEDIRKNRAAEREQQRAWEAEQARLAHERALELAKTQPRGSALAQQIREETALAMLRAGQISRSEAGRMAGLSVRDMNRAGWPIERWAHDWDSGESRLRSTYL